MFFDKSKFLSRIKDSSESLLEYSFGELKELSDPARRSRSKGITTFFKGLTQGPDGQARTLWDVPSQSKRGMNYRVTVGIEIPKIGLFGIAKEKWNPARYASVLKNMDVKVHCTCPDFYWAGPKYNLGSSGFLKGSLVPNQNAGHKGTGYNEQTVVTEPPDSRDPNREHVLCKHCIAVSTNFAANALKIMKEARAFVVKIKINDEMGKEEDSGKAILKKDIGLVNMKDDESKKITEAIIHGAEEISKEESTLQKDNSKGPEEISKAQKEPENETSLSEESPQVDNNPAIPDSGNEPQSDEKPVSTDVYDEENSMGLETIPKPKEVVPLQKETQLTAPIKVDSELNPVQSLPVDENSKINNIDPNDVLGKNASPSKDTTTPKQNQG